MIDVKQLLKTYTVAELNETADTYYKSMNFERLARKPFIVPGLQHLLGEVCYLVHGLDLRPGDYVLDFGCGVGWTSRILGACGCEVVGTDVSATAIDMARGLAEQWRQAGLLDFGDRPAIEFRLFDGHRIDLPDASVDKIFVLDAFHHVPNQAATLREFSRVLKPGGVVGMCEPGPNHSKHPDLQREMALHKVVENDIVLDDIMALGLEAGFIGMRVCLSPLLPHIVDLDDYRRFPARSDLTKAFLEVTDFRVKNYPIFFMQKAGVRALDSRSVSGLSARLELRSPAHVVCRAGETLSVQLAAANTGSAVWLPSSPKPGAVSIGYMISGPNGVAMHRMHLSNLPVAPGERVEASLTLPVMNAGRYEVEIDLVSEYVAWLKTLGSNALNLTIDVTEF